LSQKNWLVADDLEDGSAMTNPRPSAGNVVMIVHSLCSAIACNKVFSFASHGVVLGFTYKWNNRHDWTIGSRNMVRRCQAGEPIEPMGANHIASATRTRSETSNCHKGVDAAVIQACSSNVTRS
jgi:hypothetical protein